jgi:hypothetical protein
MSRSSARAGTLVVCVLLVVGPGARTLEGSEQRPVILPPLYASFGLLQVLDVHSTMEAILAGRGGEANRSMAVLAEHPAALVAVKAAATAGTILVSEQMWRRNRVAAVLLMIAVNGAYAAVVARNYRVARAAP